MENNEKLGPISGKKFFLLVILTFISGLISSLLFQLGLVVIPFTSAFLALLFLSAGENKKIIYIAPFVLLATEFLINGMYSLNCLASIIVAAVLYFGVAGKREKSECAVYITMIISAFLVISFILVGFLLTGEYSIASVKDFYIAEIDAFKSEFLAMALSLSDAYVAAGGYPLYEEADLAMLFDSALHLMISYVAVIAFFLTGIAFKLFEYFERKISTDGTRIGNWRFGTSSLFVYFYYALVLFSLFISDTSTVFGMCVINLYTIFMFVYAYIGFKYMSVILAKRVGKPLVANIVVLAATVFFITFSVQILSYVGAFMTLASVRKVQGKNNQ